MNNLIEKAIGNKLDHAGLADRFDKTDKRITSIANHYVSIYPAHTIVDRRSRGTNQTPYRPRKYALNSKI
jgi:hypothetical protein